MTRRNFLAAVCQTLNNHVAVKLPMRDAIVHPRRGGLFLLDTFLHFLTNRKNTNTLTHRAYLRDSSCAKYISAKLLFTKVRL